MSLPARIRSVVAVTVFAAAASIGIVFLAFPPPFPPSSAWLIAFGTLLALSLVSTLMALRISETGATTSLDFVPQLAAVLLLGPAGATAVAALSEIVSESLFYSKPLAKRFFNTAQMILAAAAASIVFTLSGGTSSLDSFTFRNFAPFVVAILAYFAVNTGAVSYIVSVSEGRRFTDTWRDMAGGLIIFDLVMSLLALIMAFLYTFTDQGPLVLLFAIIPLFGLRYSYGVNYELKQLNNDLLRLLIKTIEAQDPYTSGHSIRVAENSATIARALGISPKQIRTIETAALLHDIGKIDVAYGEILRQKGPLTPEQKELIRAHPDRGVDILRSIRSLHPDVLSFVRHHHERWDGDGYPAGLEGEQIPLGARIIMISDTVDAMTTARPYRDALPMSVVREELLKHRGSQFDPRIVDRIMELQLLDEIEPASSDRLPRQDVLGISTAGR